MKIGPGIISFVVTSVKPTKNMVRFEKFPGDEESNRRATMPNAYVQQRELMAAFSKLPKKVRITIEEVIEE